MDFTREPIIETVITPREGYRLVVRSSKSTGHEEHFVDAVEVISFGSAFFFRSIERPKPFVVPVSDYEVLEVREPRIVLKTPHLEGAVKIAGGKKVKASVEQEPIAREKESPKEAVKEKEREKEIAKESASNRAERRKERRRSTRRKRSSEKEPIDVTADQDVLEPPQELDLAMIVDPMPSKEPLVQQLPTLLPPPATLIRDDLARLRESSVYKGAFYESVSLKEMTEVEERQEEKQEESPIHTGFFEDEDKISVFPDDVKITPDSFD